MSMRPGMHVQNGVPIYTRLDIGRTWGKLVALHKMALG